MSEPLQVLILVAFGAFCFGCGYLTAFIVTRNRWRDEMIKRGVARYNWQTGKWEWGEPPKDFEHMGSAMIKGPADRSEYRQAAGVSLSQGRGCAAL
jgi:hypothetical protein